MTPTEAIPLLIVVLLLVSIGGGTVEQLSVSFAGDHEIEGGVDALVVAGGSNTLPANAAVTGDVYVIGGGARIEGRLDGDVTVLAGNLTVADGATVTGTIQVIAGRSTIANGASVGDVSSFEPPVPTPSPLRELGFFLAQLAVLGAVGWWLTGRHPSLLANVGNAIAEHALVSGVVGALAGVSLLVLFVYMAFTILLLPISILGLLGEFLVVLYGQVALGYLVGRHLPVDRTELATLLGIGGLLVGLEVLGFAPVVGGVIQLGLLGVGFGAVVITFFGLQRFEPATIPEVKP